MTMTHAMATVQVARGDTLSSIAAAALGSPGMWPSLWWVNRHQIANPDVITAGQLLVLPAHPAVPGWLKHAAAAAVPAPPPPPAPTPSSAGSSAGSSSGGGGSAGMPSTTVSTAGDSSFEQCVISRESGGNSQVMNSTGHYGLFQFSASTWAAHGGSPADFGHASVAEQQAVFSATVAADGTSDWAPYDGC